MSTEPTGKLVVELTDVTFDSSVSDHSGTWLVDFWAEWCGPCHALTPVLEELAGEGGEVRIAKLDVQSNPDVANRFEIQSLPTLIIFKDGVPVSRQFGPKSLRQLQNALERVNAEVRD
jgi:thioredoxin 1